MILPHRELNIQYTQTGYTVDLKAIDHDAAAYPMYVAVATKLLDLPHVNKVRLVPEEKPDISDEELEEEWSDWIVPSEKIFSFCLEGYVLRKNGDLCDKRSEIEHYLGKCFHMDEKLICVPGYLFDHDHFIQNEDYILTHTASIAEAYYKDHTRVRLDALTDFYKPSSNAILPVYIQTTPTVIFVKRQSPQEDRLQKLLSDDNMEVLASLVTDQGSN